MVFIVGQTEQASEKAKLLQQIEQVYSYDAVTDSKREFSSFSRNKNKLLVIKNLLGVKMEMKCSMKLI